MFATKTPPSSFGQSNKSRAVVVSGGKAAAETVGGMAIKKTETFVRRLSTSSEQQKKPNQSSTSTPTPRPEPVKLQHENFQPAVETAARKVMNGDKKSLIVN